MKEKSILKTICVMFPIAIKASPIRFILINILGIVQSLILVLNTILLSNFINQILAVIRTGGSQRLLFKAVLLYVSVIIGKQIINTVFNYVLKIYLELCDQKVRYLYNETISKIRPIEFEKIEVLNEIQKAESGRNVAKTFIFHLISIIDMVPPYIIFMGIYLSSLNEALVLCILLAFIPSIFNLYMQRNVFSKFEDTAAPIRRRYNNYKNCIIGRKYIKETRILGAYTFFENKLDKELNDLCREEFKVKRKIITLNTINNSIEVVCYMSALIILVLSVLKGRITIGEFTAVYNSFNVLFNMVFSFVCGFIGSSIMNLPAVQNYVNFIKQKECNNKEEIIDLQKGIILDNVSFMYPSASQCSIKNISLRINQGEHIAIVGENGAGKSTLAKLILGIYHPVSGRVLIGGLQTDKVAQKSYQKCMTVLFQDYCRYQLTMSDNVRISDFENSKHPHVFLQETRLHKELIDRCDELYLSKEFGGIELSGGQWQQVAIARSKYRENEIIVLDEPTSSIDPIEESMIYEDFMKMIKGKTSIIVSHRLGLARYSDRIIVVDAGEIVGDGTHKELYERNYLYRKMWDTQADSYK